jgi:hypothetical protein
MLLAALVLNAVIFAVLLRTWESKKQNNISHPVIEQRQGSASVGTAMNDPERHSAASVSQPAVEKTTVKENSKPSSEMKTITAEPVNETGIDVQQNQPAQTEIAEEKTVQNEQSPSNKKAASLGLNPSSQELESLRRKIREEQSPIHTSPTVENQPVEADEGITEEGVLEFSQLPSDIRDAMPEIYIKGHIYSNDSSSRLVNINGQIIKEGDTVSANLKLEEITMSGVILNYQDFRFYIRAF